jgi:hypothetical protein
MKEIIILTYAQREHLSLKYFFIHSTFTHLISALDLTGITFYSFGSYFFKLVELAYP